MLPGAEGFQSTYFWPLELIALERKLVVFAFPILQESGPLECTELRKFLAKKLLDYPIPATMGSS